MGKGKPEIVVTAIYDGKLDAVDVFADLIAQKYGRQIQQKGTKNSTVKGQDYIAESSAACYNEGEARSGRPSGLCA